jgi:hypothetical protein
LTFAMRVLVTGGRAFADAPFVWSVLDRVHAAGPVTVLVHGGARGVDSMAGAWAAARGIAEERHPADWGAHGRFASLIRNAAMVATRPDLVVVFPGGRGTGHTRHLAETAGLAVRVPGYGEDRWPSG